MQSDSVNNLVYLSALIAKSSGRIPFDISRNLVKLQKLATTLRKRYENERIYAWARSDEFLKVNLAHENKAIELARELGLQLRVQKSADWPFVIEVGKREERIG